jgi:hypothetical protein
LIVLSTANDQARLPAFSSGYAALLNSANLPAIDHSLLDLQISRLLSGALISRNGDRRAAGDRLRHNFSVAHAAFRTNARIGIYVALLVNQAERCLTTGDEPLFHISYDHLLAVVPSGKTTKVVVAGLETLAKLVMTKGRPREAVALHQRSVDLIDREPSFPTLDAIGVRIRLGLALRDVGNRSQSALVLRRALQEATDLQQQLAQQGRETEDPELLKSIAQAKLELSSAEAVLPELRRLVSSTPISVSDIVLPLVLTSANSCAKAFGQTSMEASQRYKAVALLLRGAAVDISPDLEWRAAMSLLTHALAKKSLAEGLNVLELTMMLHCADLGSNEKLKLLERVSRLFQVEYKIPERAVLIRAIDLALLLPDKLRQLPSTIFMKAIAKFLLKIGGEISATRMPEKGDVDVPTLFIALGGAIASTKSHEAMLFASRLVETRRKSGSEFGCNLGIVLHMLSALPRHASTPWLQTQRFGESLSTAAFDLDASAQKELAEPIRAALARFGALGRMEYP